MTVATVQVAELIIPRCSLRFGVGACEATGSPKCHNTYATCAFKQAFNLDGSLTYRFTRTGDSVPRIYERDGEHIKTNAYPLLRSVTQRATRINPGASRKGETPFGIKSGGTLTLMDFTSEDNVGDWYRDERQIKGSFAGMLIARLGEAQAQCTVRIYNGFEGQSLDDMQVLLWDVHAIEKRGRDSWQIEYQDPTKRIDRKRALFPRPTDIRLQTDIDETTTSITVSAALADLEDTFGNAPVQYLRYGSEIISYTGVTEVDAPIYTLDGVQRAQLFTEAQSHNADESGQRVGRYELERPYRITDDLIKNHTTFPANFINDAQWEDEGGTFLPTIVVSGTVPEPTPVEELAGELSRDGLFNIWWDERDQTVPLLAVRPPQETPLLITEADNLISANIERKPDDRMTQIWVQYGQRSPLGTRASNFLETLVRVEPELEGPFYADGTSRTNRITSRWIRTTANARLVGAQLLLRYRVTPRYLSLEFDKRDRHIRVSDVLDVETQETVDPFGQVERLRWQVIEYKETVPGHRVSVVCQSYQFVGKFAIIMANDAPSYADATEEGCWLADEATGLMPDGSDPYLLQ